MSVILFIFTHLSGNICLWGSYLLWHLQHIDDFQKSNFQWYQVHMFHYFEKRYTHPFYMKMKTVTARIIEKNSQAKWSQLSSPPIKGLISILILQAPEAIPPVHPWFLLFGINTRRLSLQLSLEMKFIHKVCWGSSFSPWVPRSWVHFIALKISNLGLPWWFSG